VRTQRFARRVEIELDGPDLQPEDNYFQLEPGGVCWVALRTISGAGPRVGPVSGRVRALNAPAFVRFSGQGASG
jgi:hypothetical protein